MSKRKSKPKGFVYEVRMAGIPGRIGKDGLGATGPDKPTRRLKCSHCPRTRKFSYDALHAVCPTCQTGRWR